MSILIGSLIGGAIAFAVVSFIVDLFIIVESKFSKVWKLETSSIRITRNVRGVARLRQPIKLRD